MDTQIPNDLLPRPPWWKRLLDRIDFWWFMVRYKWRWLSEDEIAFMTAQDAIMEAGPDAELVNSDDLMSELRLTRADMEDDGVNAAMMDRVAKEWPTED
jgi:hypothetical protein